MQRFFVFIFLFSLTKAWAQLGNLPLQWHNENGINTISLTTNYQIQTIATDNGARHFLHADQANACLQKGMPSLPYYAAPLLVPDVKGLQAVIIDSAFIVLNDIDLLPSKGDISRNANPDEVAYTFGKVYNTDAFYPQNILQHQEVFKFRDFYGQNIFITPFQYNPVKKQLRIYTRLTLQLPQTNQPVKTVTAPFDYLYKSQFLNATTFMQNGSSKPGSMLIIANPSFITAMQPFINWKKQTGMDVSMVSINSIGNDDVVIKDFITQHYFQNNISYVLLVGDAQHITSPTVAGGSSDPSYGFIDGNDSYAEVLVGRMCAQNANQIQTQVQRTIAYEQNPDTGSWPEKGIAIGSTQGTGTGLYGLADWDFERNIIRAHALNNGFALFDELFDGSQGGADANGNPNATDLSNAINDGRSVITYCGHGVQNACVTTNFSISDVVQLQNKCWPFFWAVACVNGDFTNGTCIAEALLQATDTTGPTGCAATFMASINQTWIPPMCAQEEMVHLLSADSVLPKTFAALSVGGCIKMNNNYGNGGYVMTATWHTFGDPSLQIRNKKPFLITATHDSVTYLGATKLAVNVNAGHATACIMQQGQILAVTQIDSTGTIYFNPINNSDTLKLTITAHNGIPYVANIPVLTASGSMLAATVISVNDSNANNNGRADFAETFSIALEVKNFGNSQATQVSVAISSNDTLVQISNNTVTWPNIASLSSVANQNVCMVSVNAKVPDEHQAVFTITFTDSAQNIQQQYFTLNCNAPQIKIIGININDSAGNNNKVFDTGESAQLQVMVTNTGHADVFVNDSIYSNSNLNFNSATAGGFNLQANDTLCRLYDVKVDSNAITSALIPVQYSLQHHGITHTYSSVNYTNIWFEDFESNTMKRFPWMFNNIPWLTQNSVVHQQNFAARSGIVDDSETSTMFVEGVVALADSISFYAATSSEPQYDFLRFYINGVEQLALSGQNPFHYYSYAIPAGNYNFKWSYIKDAYTSSGADAAFLDNIKLPYFTSMASMVENHTPLNAFPNPAKDFFNVQLINTASVDAVTFINVYGQQVSLPYVSDAHILNIDVSSLSNGWYVCCLSTMQGVKYIKCVINK